MDALREENNGLRGDLKTAQNTASLATKDAKQLKEDAKRLKEDLQTLRLDKDYQASLVDQKTSLVETLQGDLQSATLKSEQLAGEVESLKDFNATAAVAQAEELEDSKDAIKSCFYMFWKHNRNADFSYLGEAYAADEAECLERLAEEEAEAAAAKDATPQDPQVPEA